MTEREREREKLIELLEEADQVAQAKGITDYKDAIADNADHLLSNGVIVPPIEIGQTVWFISPVSYKPKITETVIEKVVWKSGGMYIKLGCNSMYETSCKSIGKTVFLTKEEAEKALKERNEGK